MLNRWPFRVISEIGRGAFAIVVEAVDKEGGFGPVAVKRLRDEVRRNSEDLARFRREVRILRELQHPNIVQILDADLESADPWFAMTLAETTLERAVPIAKGLDASRVDSIFISILDAMICAHEQGVIHRDLKPHNVLLIDGEPIVSDFGLGMQINSESATLTVTGATGGTFGYVAPEQWTGMHEVDARADVFGLGSLLFYLATGLNPVSLSPKTLPDRYAYIIRRCRETDPADRYLTVRDLRDEFLRVVTPGALLVSTVDRANELIAGSMVDPSTRKEMFEIYLNHASDRELYRQTLPTWPEELLQDACKNSPQALHQILVAFDQHLDGHLDFDYVDVAAEFLSRVVVVSSDRDVHRLAINRILAMGHWHDRFKAGRIFARIASSAKKTASILIVRDVLHENPAAANWVAQYVRNEGAVPLIIEALDGNRPDSSNEQFVTVGTSSAISTSSGQYLYPGLGVSHPKFGSGIVQAIREREGDREILVDFERVGRKRLLESLEGMEPEEPPF